jgi:hypothetical protein
MKKILSILLSAILAVSVLGISASARPLGDVDSDKKANAADALKILQYTVGALDAIDKRLADVNCDGTVNSADALIVLRICVGAYEGSTEVDLKPEVIDPIMKTGKFTLTTIVDTEDENGKPISIPSTIMVSGNNMCTSMKYSGMNVKLLILNGKVYMIMPDLKVYVEMSEDDIGGLDIGNMTFDDNSTYAGSFYSTYDGKTYTVDSYRADDGSVTDYYFLNGKWAMVGEHSAKPEAAQKITDFKAGVDESYFSLKGFVKIDIDKLSK